MPSNHLIFCCPLLLLPSIFPSIRVFSNELCLSSSYSQRKWGTDTTALSFIRDFIKVKFLGLKESVREHKAHEASSDLIVNHWLRFFVGIAASFQVQIIVRILLWPHRLVGGVSLPYPKHEQHEGDEAEEVLTHEVPVNRSRGHVHTVPDIHVQVPVHLRQKGRSPSHTALPAKGRQSRVIRASNKTWKAFSCPGQYSESHIWDTLAHRTGCWLMSGFGWSDTVPIMNIHNSRASIILRSPLHTHTHTQGTSDLRALDPASLGRKTLVLLMFSR